jgi:hypothetical protein
MLTAQVDSTMSRSPKQIKHEPITHRAMLIAEPYEILLLFFAMNKDVTMQAIGNIANMIPITS